MVSHRPDKFGCHRHSCSRDIRVLLCHVTLPEHVIKAFYDSMVRRLSRYITILPSLVAIGNVVVEI